LEKLTKSGFNVTGLFYNPNIHPFSEYRLRKEATEELSKSLGIKIFFPEYHPEEYFRQVNYKEDSIERCYLCWSLRLNKTARLAKQNNFDYFSTTLLVSPYQDQEAIKKIGLDTASREGIKFYFEDFRPGFRLAHEQARAKGIYCQKYCGCLYSEVARCRKSRKP